MKFISRPIVIGFTNGIALLIASTQIKDFFGLTISKVPGELWLRMETSTANTAAEDVFERMETKAVAGVK